jgi:type I restriction enzyme S subunit
MSGSATGTPQQSTVIVTDAFDGCVATTGFGVLRAKQGVDPAFLYFMLRSSYILDEIARWLTGATIPSISASSFKKIQIPVPPIQVQKRIVSILRKASEESEKLTTEERNLIKKAEELDQEAENEFWHCLLMENESHSKIS